jgi:hypothetical protein
MRCVAGWAGLAGVYAVIPIYPCWRRAVGGRAAGEDLYRARSDSTHATSCNGVYSYQGRSDLTHSFGHEAEIVFLCIKINRFLKVLEYETVL